MRAHKATIHVPQSNLDRSHMIQEVGSTMGSSKNTSDCLDADTTSLEDVRGKQ